MRLEAKKHLHDNQATADDGRILCPMVASKVPSLRR
jgi:hypothetical protein